jgi:uncharacterized protein
VKPVLSLLRRLSWTLLCSALAWPAAARDVAGLYAARVPVADRTPAELARSTRAALGEVLVKLTGERTAAREGASSRVLGQASKLVVKYAYQTVPGSSDLFLVAEFDERAVLDELAQRGVAVWGKERPDTLVWLVVDDGTQRHVPSSDEQGFVGEAIMAAADRRGIPVLLPLQDIEERQHLGQATDWAGITATVPALAARYATPAVLFGLVRHGASGQWDADWQLAVDGEPRTWRHSAETVQVLIDAGIDTLSDALAQRYADPGMLAQADTVALDIVGVDSAAAYARVVNYLGALDTVSNLFVVAVTPERLAIRFDARGGRTGFAQSVAFGQVLAPVAGRADTFQLLR